MYYLRVISFTALLSLAGLPVRAQVHTAHYLPEQKIISILFKDDVTAISLDKTLIYYENEQGQLVQIWATVSQSANEKRRVELSNFHLNFPAGPAMDLTDKITDGDQRVYFVVLKEVNTASGAGGKRLQVTVPVGSLKAKPPKLFVFADPKKNQKLLQVQPAGIASRVLYDAFKETPEKIEINYDFDDNDIAVDFNSTAARLSLPTAPSASLNIELNEPLLPSTESYVVTVKFPLTETLRKSTSNNYRFAADEKTFEGSKEVELELNQPDRDASEYYFEAGFTSTGNATTGKRNNVGLFALHLKPTIRQLSWNMDGSSGNQPTWLAVRPLLEADFDTLPIKDSEAPNRTQLGVDFELGRVVGLAKKKEEKSRSKFLDYFVWTNGVRYDSDRDFKLQTTYWETTFTPFFRNFRQDQPYTLYRYRYDEKGVLREARRGRQPLVSAYSIAPSLGHQLGGITRRDIGETTFPSDTIARLFLRAEASLELKRIFRFGLKNTYYFLDNLPKKRHHNYLEARFEVSTGYLLRLGASGIQSALSFKFQQGEQPPTFKPVNIFSMGFKLSR